jgi:hypothetical protein
MIGSNLGQDTGYPEIFRGFCEFLQENSGVDETTAQHSRLCRHGTRPVTSSPNLVLRWDYLGFVGLSEIQSFFLGSTKRELDARKETDRLDNKA